MSAPSKRPKVKLIPWDPTSEQHIERMYIQRLSCGWRSEEVRDKWVQLSSEGTKTLYWIVLDDDLPEREEYIVKHITANPKESTPINDTATHHWTLPRPPPTGPSPIHPIGHIALDLRPDQNAKLNFPSPSSPSSPTSQNIVWVAGLYVSHVLQSTGLGRAAMHEAEQLSSAALTTTTSEDGDDVVNGHWIVLDTMSREQQMSSGFLQTIYAAQGNPVPTVATQDWYERQGYAVFDRWKAGYTWRNPQTGETEDIDYVFLRKWIAG